MTFLSSLLRPRHRLPRPLRHHHRRLRPHRPHIRRRHPLLRRHRPRLRDDVCASYPRGASCGRRSQTRRWPRLQRRPRSRKPDPQRCWARSAPSQQRDPTPAPS
ncbi:hypothetical protein VPH35_040409 [Triticum aestivum]